MYLPTWCRSGLSLLLAVGVLEGLGCSAPKVYLPRSPDSEACARDCAQTYEACRQASQRYLLTPYSSPSESRRAETGEARSCAYQQADCRKGCPGATTQAPR